MEVAILISDKIDFEIKTMIRDKEGHYIMIKGSIQEEDITIINIYEPNIGAPQYVRRMLTKKNGEINSNTIIVGDINTPLTPMDRSTKQKISKETQKSFLKTNPNSKVNGNWIISINNHVKCKWVKFSNQKTKTGQMDTKIKPLYMLSTKDPRQT